MTLMHPAIQSSGIDIDHKAIPTYHVSNDSYYFF